jgi:hypothetical protein
MEAFDFNTIGYRFLFLVTKNSMCPFISKPQGRTTISLSTLVVQVDAK